MTLKRFEILPSLPPYGPMYIPVSESGKPFYNEGVAVRLKRDDGSEWVANFEPGWTKLKQVIELELSRNVLVIAQGTCYLMDTNESKPLAVFGAAYTEACKTSRGRWVMNNGIELTIVEPDGTYWHTERISWDGIEDLKVEDNRVTGMSFQPTHETEEWVHFSYDIDKRELTGGSFSEHQTVKKPWWKIWT